jgi:hypothetical protein
MNDHFYESYVYLKNPDPIHGPWLAIAWNSRPFYKASASARLKLEQLNKKRVYTYTAKSVKRKEDERFGGLTIFGLALSMTGQSCSSPPPE